MFSGFGKMLRRGGALAALVSVSAVATGYTYQPEQVRNGGTISGIVKFGGKLPTPVPLAITKDRDVCGSSPVYDQSLVIGRDHGVVNAVVALPDLTDAARMKPDPGVPFDQKGCEYIPHVAVFPVGSTVVITNSDGILHNIHTESVINPVIDLAQPGFKKQIRVTIEKPEIIKLTCDAHNWMEGWWYVAGNPYYAITDAHGHYAIHNVPPGTYTVRVWQERLGTQTLAVVVRANATTAADFTLNPVQKQRS